MSEEKIKHPVGKEVKKVDFNEGEETPAPKPVQTKNVIGAPEAPGKPETTPPVEPPKEEMISISKKSFDEFLESMKTMKEEQKILFEIADKRQLHRVRQRSSKDLPKEMGIREYDGKIVVGWELIEDVIMKSPTTGIYTEKQTVKLIFEDGTDITVNMVDFESGYTKILCKRTGVMKDEITGSSIFKLVRLDSGEEIEIGESFIN